MSKRKASIVLAVVWMMALVIGLLATVQANGSEEYITAEVIYNADGEIVGHDAMGWRRRKNESFRWKGR